MIHQTGVKNWYCFGVLLTRHNHHIQSTAQKWSFPLKISLVNVTKSAGTADLDTFSGEVFNGKLHFLFSGDVSKTLANI